MTSSCGILTSGGCRSKCYIDRDGKTNYLRSKIVKTYTHTTNRNTRDYCTVEMKAMHLHGCVCVCVYNRHYNYIHHLSTCIVTVLNTQSLQGLIDRNITNFQNWICTHFYIEYHVNINKIQFICIHFNIMLPILMIWEYILVQLCQVINMILISLDLKWNIN